MLPLRRVAWCPVAGRGYSSLKYASFHGEGTVPPLVPAVSGGLSSPVRNLLSRNVIYRSRRSPLCRPQSIRRYAGRCDGEARSLPAVPLLSGSELSADSVLPPESPSGLGRPADDWRVQSLGVEKAVETAPPTVHLRAEMGAPRDARSRSRTGGRAARAGYRTLQASTARFQEEMLAIQRAAAPFFRLLAARELNVRTGDSTPFTLTS